LPRTGSEDPRVGLDAPREGELVEGIEDDPELGVEGVAILSCFCDEFSNKLIY